MMGLGFFVLESAGHRYIYHDGDQGGFSSELMVDPAGHSASVLIVNTTDTGAPRSRCDACRVQYRTRPAYRSAADIANRFD